MTIKATVALALAALVRNKARSLLTMLGIVIGVAAVIVTVAIGVGARTSVQQSINSLGSNLIVVQPGSVNQTGARGGFGTASTLTPDDGLAIAKLPGVAAVSPMVSVRAQVVAGQNNWQTTIAGVAPTYTFIRSWASRPGPFFNDSDVASAAKVAVLGQTVIAELFPNGDSPLGQTVIIKGVPVHRDRDADRARSERSRARPGRHRLDSLYVGDGTPDRTDDGKLADGLGR